MTYNAIHFDLSDRIAVITLNRPDRLNAINEEMRSSVTGLPQSSGPKTTG